MNLHAGRFRFVKLMFCFVAGAVDVTKNFPSGINKVFLCSDGNETASTVLFHCICAGLLHVQVEQLQKGLFNLEAPQNASHQS